MFEVEESLLDMGFNTVLGIDEAGMGALCGPIAIGGVILPPNYKLDGLNDSKKVSEKNREKLAKLIYEQAILAQVVFVMHGVVDKENVRKAAQLGIMSLVNSLCYNIDTVVIDGTYKFEKPTLYLKYPYISIIKGDNKSANIAAASIIAKVARDAWIKQVAVEYPMYDWNKNKGYGTKKHIEALKKYGCSRYHRTSYTIKGTPLNELTN